MVEQIGHIRNPLTVISIFAAIAEISGTTVLPFIEPDNQAVYVWFLMLFPIFLVGIFFITLNFNHKVLYAPSDYKNEDNFIKSFGRATTEEKEEKLREELEESADQERIVPKVDTGVGDKSYIASYQMTQNSLMASVALAERLAINKLSKEVGVEFKTEVRFQAPSGRKILFDGLAIEKNIIHAAEIKLFRHEQVSVGRLDKVLLESEIMKSYLEGIDGKEFVLHFVAVVDNPEVNIERIKERLSKYINTFNANVKLYVVSLEDLRNEYQYSPR